MRHLPPISIVHQDDTIAIHAHPSNDILKRGVFYRLWAYGQGLETSHARTRGIEVQSWYTVDSMWTTWQTRVSENLSPRHTQRRNLVAEDRGVSYPILAPLLSTVASLAQV